MSSKAPVRIKNVKPTFCVWYRCQFCPRAFRKCEDLVDHKVLDHLQEFRQSQDPSEILKKLQVGNQDEVETESSAESETETRITVDQPKLRRRRRRQHLKWLRPKQHRWQKNLIKSVFLTQPAPSIHNVKVVRLQRGRTGYECRFCRKIVSNKFICVDHENSHLGAHRHKCKSCSEAFIWTQQRDKHQRTCQRSLKEQPTAATASVTVEATEKTQEENSKSESSDTIKQESAFAPELGNFSNSEKLPIASLSEQISIWIEVRIRGGRVGYECQLCSKIVSDQAYCIDHENMHLGIRNYSCQFCSKDFISRKNGKSHEHKCAARRSEVKATTKSPLSKTNSGLVSEQKQNQSENKNNKEAGKEAQYPGQKELESQDQKARLSENRKPGTAEKCKGKINAATRKPKPVGLPPPNFFSRLFRTSLSESGDLEYVCSICSSILSSKASAIIHYKIHTNSRTFNCSRCSQTFKSHSIFWDHELTHSGKKRRTCSRCGLKFSYGSRSQLCLHERWCAVEVK